MSNLVALKPSWVSETVEFNENINSVIILSLPKSIKPE